MGVKNLTGAERPISKLELGRFQERLTKLQGERSLRAFARFLDVSEGAARRWFDGSGEPSRPNLLKIAEKTGCDIAWLVRGDEADYNAVAESVAEYRIDRAHDEFAFVPLINAEPSAGDGSFTDDETEVLERYAYRHDWLADHSLDAGKLVLVALRGDSMLPMFEDGQRVLVDLRATSLEHDGVYVARYDGLLLVKRFQRELSGSVLVISANQNYAPQRIEADQLNQLTIIGRVAWPLSRG